MYASVYSLLFGGRCITLTHKQSLTLTVNAHIANKPSIQFEGTIWMVFVFEVNSQQQSNRDKLAYDIFFFKDHNQRNSSL